MNEHFSEVPDFSGDDFSNDKEIQKARKEAEAHRQMIQNSLAILKSELNLIDSSHKNFKAFNMFKGLQATIVDSYLAADYPSKIIISIAEYLSSFPTARDSNTGNEQYLFGYMELAKEFPSTYICKESIQQKIINLFIKTDSDFAEHRKFSRRFNVVTKDNKRLADLLRLKPLNELSAFPDMELEIHDRYCLYRNSRCSLSPEDATQFSKLTKMLYRVLN